MAIDYVEAIRLSRKALPNDRVAQKIFLSYPTFAFSGNEDLAYQLTSEVADFFNISISSVSVAGSGKTGFSFHKESTFSIKNSDLDLAIIDPTTFLSHLERALRDSEGYQLTKFTTKNGRSTRNDFMSYLAKGMFRPDLMPIGEERQKLINFKNKLSRNYKLIAADISIALYATEKAFLHKQSRSIEYTNIV